MLSVKLEHQPSLAPPTNLTSQKLCCQVFDLFNSPTFVFNQSHSTGKTLEKKKTSQSENQNSTTFRYFHWTTLCKSFQRALSALCHVGVFFLHVLFSEHFFELYWRVFAVLRAWLPPFSPRSPLRITRQKLAGRYLSFYSPSF